MTRLEIFPIVMASTLPFSYQLPFC